MKHYISISLVIFFSLTETLNAFGQGSESLRVKHLNANKAHVALQGYDPVSYFQFDAPEKGVKKLTYKHKGITYYFANASNMNAFKTNPAKYEPQYGGWCAYAIGTTGDKVKVDPESFKIVNGKLYLFYNFYFNNTLTLWNKDEDNLKSKADKNWKKIIE